MRLTAEQYLSSKHKRVTIMGMSGVGKTTLARKLSPAHWFHYSGDYRIGSAYLSEDISDLAKHEAMRSAMLRKLMHSDSVNISLKLSIDNLSPMSEYLGKIGNPDVGGLPLAEFKRRQKKHHDAEVRAILDVPEFIDKAQTIYGCDHFLCDIGGSLCELDDQRAIETLAEYTVMLYIQASAADEAKLIERAKAYPKPLYYPEDFLDQHLALFKAERGLDYTAQIDPDEFVVWVFPQLFRSRLPKYQAYAEQYGYTVSADEVAAVNNQEDFDALVVSALERSCH